MDEQTETQNEAQSEAQNETQDVTQDEAHEEPLIYCVNHPETETLLRCNRCGKPICLKCSVLTDVGYRCKECIRGVQDSYYNANPADNWIALAVSFVIALIATPILGLLLGRFGFLGIIIAFLMGSGAGGTLAQIIRRSVGKRRGRNLRYFAMAGFAFGVLVNLPFAIWSLPLLLFVIIALSTAYQLLR